MTPTFMGSEPTIANFGLDSPYEGTKVLRKELTAGFRLMRSLTAEQRAVAIVQGSPSDLVAGAYADNAVIPYEASMPVI